MVVNDKQVKLNATYVKVTLQIRKENIHLQQQLH